MFRFLPEQASEVAPQVDWIHNLVTDLSVFFTVAIVGTMLYFAIRYRRRDGVDHETPQIRGSHLLEVIWTTVPTLICVYIAYYGIKIFHELREVPADAMEVQVRGQKWKWDFEYANGKQTTGEATIPVGKPVKFVLQSRDVLHSFFVPSMRVKSDAVPGQYTYVSFRPVKTGDYQVFCTEYCGMQHSGMLAKLHVVSDAEYQAWLKDDSDKVRAAAMPASERGKALYTQKGCNQCHSLNGIPGVGPSWLKIFGHEGKLTTGESYKADENYIKESILHPTAKVVQGFSPIMPSFEGQLNDEEITSIIEFMKTLKEAPAAAAAAPQVDESKLTPVELGKKIYTEKACAGCHSLDGSKIVGPSFKGLYGRQEKLSDGTTVTADDEYIKHSVLEPTAQVVEGFQPVMPSFKGQLDDKQLNAVVEFIKSQK